MKKNKDKEKQHNKTEKENKKGRLGDAPRFDTTFPWFGAWVTSSFHVRFTDMIGGSETKCVMILRVMGRKQNITSYLQIIFITWMEPRFGLLHRSLQHWFWLVHIFRSTLLLDIDILPIFSLIDLSYLRCISELSIKWDVLDDSIDTNMVQIWLQLNKLLLFKVTNYVISDLHIEKRYDMTSPIEIQDKIITF